MALLEAALGTKALGYGSDFSLFEAGTASESVTVFRTWVSDLDDPDANPASLFAGATWPLTEKARQVAAQFNPVTDTTTEGCTQKGMPAITRQPFPIEFVDRGDTLELKIEEYDTRRTIHLRATAPADVPRTPLGYSVGKWEGSTLVITDPDSLTAPIEGKRSWVWRPDEKVMPFNCTANPESPRGR